MTSATDLTGGQEPGVDEITAETPQSRAFREGVSMWIWDHSGRWGLPRVGVEAVGATWNTSRAVMLNLVLPDGRVLALRDDAAPCAAKTVDGHPRVFGAGPARFECLEPFVHWHLAFDGTVAVGHAEEGIGDHPLSDDGSSEQAAVQLNIDAQMATPPWIQGSLRPDGQFLEGEHRFEQLFTATGTVAIDGEKVAFDGGGLRIHRKGGDRAQFQDWHGHCWQSALFPSGRALGFIHYHPRPDGSVKYQEGWLMDGRDVRPARVVGTPWMRGITPTGEDVSFTLRTSDGDVRIEAETFVSAFSLAKPPARGGSGPTLQSGITRCRWGHEESYGMIERSAYF